MAIQSNFPALKPTLLLDFANTESVDPRITFTRATAATYFDQLGVLRTAASGVPRIDHNPVTGETLGLLIEEQRTNGIRNNTMVGAVAGTPGTVPTNWTGSATPTTGISREIIGTGTEDGINYIDVRFFGTATGAAFFSFRFEQANFVAASNGQIWTSSFYAKLVGGSLTNVSNLVNVIVFNDSTSTNLQFVTQTFTPTSASLKTQRISRSGTASNAATAFVQSFLQIEVASGLAIDVTLRIGLPQLEQGAFATSPILTSGSQATRNADVASMTGTNFSSWYRADEGTIYGEAATFSTSTTNFPRTYAISDGSATNGIHISRNPGPGQARVSVVTGGVSQVAHDIGAQAVSAVARTASAYKLNDYAAVINAGTVVTDTSGTVPSVNRLNIGIDGFGANDSLNGHIRKIAYYPLRLTNTQLQAITG